MTRRALIFRHMKEDTGGLYPALLRSLGFDVAMHDWQDGEAPAAATLAATDIIVALGGAQQVWEEDRHPWLKAEKAIIADWVGAQAKPYVGLCLGHQLLADALGGKVGMAGHKEVGVSTVTFSGETADCRVFNAFSGSTPVTQWHEAEVTHAPDVATVLASSGKCAVQMLAVDGHAFSTQFHHEWDLPTVHGWIPQWKTAMDDATGQPGSYAAFASEMAREEPHLSRLSHGLFASFMKANGLAG